MVKWSGLGVMKMYKSAKGKKRRKYANGEDILQCTYELKVTFRYKENKETSKPTQNFAKILELLIRTLELLSIMVYLFLLFRSGGPG
jgi:hypothetical protein